MGEAGTRKGHDLPTRDEGAQRRWLAFVGDLMLGRGVSAALERRSPADLLGDTLGLLQSTAGVVGNLESPITTHPQPWNDGWKAFRFRADPTAAQGLLAAAKVRFVALANNHALDYGAEGLADTILHVGAAGIAMAGAGSDHVAAMRPTVADFDGLTVGFLAATDTMPEFRAGLHHPGTNYMAIRNDLPTLAYIRLAVEALRRAGAGLVVLSVHWGPNLRPFPPARYRSFARMAIDLGVDVVHGHSAHLLQGVEPHHGGVILYDTGNFIDDYWVFPGVRIDRSCVFLVEHNGNRILRLRVVPVSLKRPGVRLARGLEAMAIMATLEQRSQALGTTGFVRVSGGLESGHRRRDRGRFDDRRRGSRRKSWSLK